MHKKSPFPAATAALILSMTLFGAAAGCGGGGGSGSDTGILTIGITDAAVDGAVAVVVQFSGIELQPAGGDRLTYTFTPNRIIDLLALQGGVRATLLDGEIVPAGDYNWIRLMVVAEPGVTDSFIEFPDTPTNRVESLRVPSGSTSGLQLSGGFTVAAGDVTDFTIDFDLRKSVHDPQGLPDYLLRPSLRLVDNLVVGSISGMVDSDLVTADTCANDVPGGAVYVFSGADAVVDEEGSATPPLTSAMVTLEEGSDPWTYMAAFLEPGDYTVAFTCEAANDTPEDGDMIGFDGGPYNVTVVAETDTPRDF
jgi:hypothetical protein